ncbi:MAG: TlpA disulfide reductase family protein [Imperialibacter sp.]|uniref:TlpA family protein disulfide reductase n=1 Tax=Imperialibacter sp. TaxID=2038411 RepID=UPI0032F0313E
MKRLSYYIFFTFIITATCCRVNDGDILQNTISKLNSLETIEYEYVFERVDHDRGIDDRETATSFYDFSSQDTLIAAKYLFQSKYGKEVFDGKTAFMCSTEDKRILYMNNPTRNHVGGSFWMQNSLLTLRTLLPKMLEDSSVTIVQQKDEIIDNQSYYKFNIQLKNRNIVAGVDIINQEGTVFEQELLINKDTYLPFSYRTISPDNKGFKLVTFKNISTKATRPDSVWNYERYPQEFVRQTYDEFYASEAAEMSGKIGVEAPDWKLPMVDGDSVSLASQIGHLVLLEFWFPYCKGCVESVPDINDIQEKYRSKGLRVYGVETLDSDLDKLSSYIKKYSIKYPTLYNGKLVAKAYETLGAPTFILLDKAGRFIYMREGFNKEELIASIEENL